MGHLLKNINGKGLHFHKQGDKIHREVDFGNWLSLNQNLPQYPPFFLESSGLYVKLIGESNPSRFGRIYNQDAFKANLDKVVELLFHLDSSITNLDCDDDPRCHWQNIEDNVGEWITDNISKDLLSNQKRDAVIYAIRKGQEFSRPCYQHGDLTPWHFLSHAGKIYVIDAEHASWNYPAHFDAAYLYGILAGHCDDQPTAKLFIKIFRAASGNNLNEVLFRSLRLRVLVGMLSWAYESKSKSYLARCLDEIDRLL